MKNLHLIGLAALLSITTACAARTEPAPGPNGKQSAPVDGEPDQGPPPAPAPSPAPSPAPAPTCTPLAKSTGTANPASVYCAALGYEVDAENCKFPDGASCEQWSFYRGECGQPHSFCNLHGGAVSNKTEDMGGWTASYAVCTLPDGKSCQEDTFAHTCGCE